jgi:hypothetical protein
MGAGQDRVLFLLKETYGYQGCGILRIEECAASWLDANIKTYVNAAHLAAAIQTGLHQGFPLSADEIAALLKDRSKLHSALETMALWTSRSIRGTAIRTTGKSAKNRTKMRPS